ncbi:MAG: single-stranded-DNA-specific exonuclease RecJ [Candidatus Competibacterales bacterium]|nr:single-stranded-DNA-specific exonuclease RecJ [Candidatus Competibacterales bacterium]
MSTVIVRRHAPVLPELPVSPLLRRIYAHRGITSPEDLEHGLKKLPAPDALRGIDRAVGLLETALREARRMLIVADYDADGATSCALAVRALTALGAADVRFVVPNRFEYGYGLTPEIVELAAAEQPDLLITVDNGIASLDGVAAARERGMRVLITDHHLPGAVLPDADAIVNPNQPDDGFPSKHLAGVGVIFYVLLALRARLRESDWFTQRGIEEPDMRRFLDLVAFGTVADVVPLDRVNRLLIAQGLKRIRAGRSQPGITALCEIARRNPATLTARDIGFFVAPRLNAAGRLEDMALGIRCLLSDDPAEARRIAADLDRLNRERRDIEGEMLNHALNQIDDRLRGELPFGLCLYDAGWHQGVIGILAARVRERTHRPVIAFAPERDGWIKGSARSVPGLHVRDALDAVATRHPGLIRKFGGHAMAAGLSLEHDRLDDFQAAFDAEVRRHLAAEDLQGVLHSDGELTPGELCLAVAEELREAGPWGQQFPEPLFDGTFEIVSGQVLKEQHLKLVLCPPANSTIVDAIAFNRAAEFGRPEPGRRVRIAYRLDVNEWRGRRSVQLIVEHIEPG